MKVTCSVALPDDLADGFFDEPVTLRLSVQNVTVLDASSSVVADLAVEVGSAGEVVGPFELEVELLPGRTYAAYAHVGPSPGETVHPGDLVTTTRVPVAAGSGDTEVVIPVRTVT